MQGFPLTEIECPPVAAWRYGALAEIARAVLVFGSFIVAILLAN